MASISSNRMVRSLLFSGLLPTFVSAHPWVGPAETLTASSTADWSPAPTIRARDDDPAGSEPTQKPDYPVSLCGWQGPARQDVYCSTKSSCVWFTDKSIVGCCAIGGYCDGAFTECVDATETRNKVSTPGIYTCKNSELCYLNTYPMGYHQYGCDTTRDGETVVTSFDSMDPNYNTLQAVFTGNFESAISPPGDSTTTLNTTIFTTGREGTATILPSASSGSSSLNASSTSSTSTARPTGSSTSGISTHTKSGITGGVGGMAIVGVALLILYLLRRRKQHKELVRFPKTPGYGGVRSGAGDDAINPSFFDHQMSETSQPTKEPLSSPDFMLANDGKWESGGKRDFRITNADLPAELAHPEMEGANGEGLGIEIAGHRYSQTAPYALESNSRPSSLRSSETTPVSPLVSPQPSVRSPISTQSPVSSLDTNAVFAELPGNKHAEISNEMPVNSSAAPTRSAPNYPSTVFELP